MITTKKFKGLHQIKCMEYSLNIKSAQIRKIKKIGCVYIDVYIPRAHMYMLWRHKKYLTDGSVQNFRNLTKLLL